MTYIHRTLERKFLKMSSAFKVVMVTGARQVGKSTMLKTLAQDTGRTFASMDDSELRELAQRDPKLFFQIYKPPILIDEVQKAPALFEQIKILCDESDERGRFWLTGSQSKKLMKQAGDSLAGRICILKMFSLSAKEIAGRPDDIIESYSFDSLMNRSRELPTNDILDVYTRIWEGGMPDMQVLTWDGQLLALELPQTVDLEIVETAPGIKGASASARNKPATLSTGLVIQVPEYLSPGEKIRIHIEERRYMGRAD